MSPRWTWVFLIVHFASRVLIATGETCSYSEEVAKKGPQNLWSGFTSTADVSACQTFCGTQTGCVAGEFNSQSFSCYLYNVVPTLTDDTQTTFFQRTCVPDTTTTTLAPTTTPTTTPATTTATPTTTSPASCEMTRSTGTTGVSDYYKFSLRDVDSCNSICLYIGTCRATTYRLGICTLHPETSTAASGDIVDFVRHTCYKGTFCCMNSSSTLRASGSPLLSINTSESLYGCEAICLAVADCQGTYYSDEFCFFYTTTSTTFGGTVVFSSKTCPVQTHRGDLAFDGTCKDTNNTASTSIIHGNIIALLIIHISGTLSWCSFFWKSSCD
ncbi:location of vulva defective 1-like isoform X3 [Haliotis asinina]|uniref:location of vulva defective 1-like isoform X3 n=1 Tax=Haliotis asinina TaxID=109174 RepID=UPI0035319A4B